jgi:hypothetical protein
MGRLTLNLSEQDQSLLSARAAHAGHSSIEEHVAALIRADIERFEHGTDEADPGAPERLRVHSNAELEAKLLEGLNSPASEMRDEDWDEMRRRFLQRQQRVVQR